MNNQNECKHLVSLWILIYFSFLKNTFKKLFLFQFQKKNDDRFAMFYWCWWLMQFIVIKFEYWMSISLSKKIYIKIKKDKKLLIIFQLRKLVIHIVINLFVKNIIIKIVECFSFALNFFKSVIFLLWWLMIIYIWGLPSLS